MSASLHESVAPPRRAAVPRRIIALGGGTGMPNVLRGLRRVVASVASPVELTAIVTMTDDGGSSGRLRRTMGLPPPGDIRKCLVALCEEEQLLAGLFQHRYVACRELGGHSVGNLILAALAEQTGSFLKAVEVSSRVLRTSGRILPSTEDDVCLQALLDDGSVLRGETNIANCARTIRSVSLYPGDARPTTGVIDSILAADLLIVGPGSLYTSILPNIVVDGVGDALRETSGTVVMVANLVSEPREDAGLELEDHLRIVEEHAGGSFVDAVLVNDGPIAADVLERYRAQGATPLGWGDSGHPTGPRVFRQNLLASGPKLRHEPSATVEGLMAAWSTMSQGPRARASR